jgi:putative ABC transport system substrate-binding protein
MKRILIWSLLTVSLITFSLAEAQQPGKVYLIGRLGAGFPIKPFNEAFSQGLRDLGYIEGKNISIEYRYAEGRFDRLPELAADLVRMKVDVIVAGSDQSIHAARQITSTIPIVIAQSGGPLARGLVESLARPGGNITGLTGYDPGKEGQNIRAIQGSVS